MPKVSLQDVESIMGNIPSPLSIDDTVKASVKYQSYVKCQERDTRTTISKTREHIGQ